MSKNKAESIAEKLSNLKQRIVDARTRMGNRDKHSKSHMDALMDIITIWGVCEQHTSDMAVKDALAQYVTIKLVAVLQAGTRDFVTDVINMKEKKGLPLPTKPIETTIDIIRSLRNQDLSLGEYVAHTMNTNSWEAMTATVQVATGKTIKELIVDFSVGSGTDVATANRDAADCESNIAELLAERNIVCHEIGKSAPLHRGIFNYWLINVLMVLVAYGEHSKLLQAVAPVV